ncbi:MAG: hypothetical protein GC180_12375 [Bacteroidetes bacterium]|nr:hypothetical protein [Bacteroidota bacterium]
MSSCRRKTIEELLGDVGIKAYWTTVDNRLVFEYDSQSLMNRRSFEYYVCYDTLALPLIEGPIASTGNKNSNFVFSDTLSRNRAYNFRIWVGENYSQFGNYYYEKTVTHLDSITPHANPEPACVLEQNTLADGYHELQQIDSVVGPDLVGYFGVIRVYAPKTEIQIRFRGLPGSGVYLTGHYSNKIPFGTAEVMVKVDGRDYYSEKGEPVFIHENPDGSLDLTICSAKWYTELATRIHLSQ